MARGVAAFSLIELTITVAVLAILAIPIGGLVVEQLSASVRMDGTVAAENFARYEQELFQLRSATQSWCSVRRGDLPASDPDRSACPAGNPNAPNPYVNSGFVVYRVNEPQDATDGSNNSVRRITVIVKRIVQSNGSSIILLEPLATVTTFMDTAATFSP